MTDAAVSTKTRSKIKPPSMYKVVLINDDYTPVDFVIAVLMQIFNKPAEEASAITLHIHNNGRGVAGIFTLEIAKQKQEESHRAARAYGYPLKVVIEESAT